MSKQIIKNYTFDISSKKITLNDFSGMTIDLSRLALITDVTLNRIIYNFADNSVTATISGNDIILNDLPDNAQNTDILRIDYDSLIDDPVYSATPIYNAKQEAYEDIDRQALRQISPAFFDVFKPGGTLSAGTVIIPPQDIGEFTWLAINVYVGGTWNASINIQQSDDESTFTDSQIYNATSPNSAPLTRITANGRYLVKKTGRYLKAFYDTFSVGAPVTLTVQYFTTPWPNFELVLPALTPYLNQNLLATPVTVRSSRCRWKKYYAYNPNPTPIYLQCFNKLIANVTVGTTTPDEIYQIPAYGYWDGYWRQSSDWSIGLVIAATADLSNTAPNSGVLVNLGVE